MRKQRQSRQNPACCQATADALGFLAKNGQHIRIQCSSRLVASTPKKLQRRGSKKKIRKKIRKKKIMTKKIRKKKITKKKIIKRIVR